MNPSPKYGLINYFTAGLLVAYLITGLCLSGDYGVNWDDEVQRINGLNNWEFISGQNTRHLQESTDRYHGPAFEILLIGVEKLLNLTGYHDIFLARHRCVFFFWIVGAGAFFLLSKKLFSSAWLALLAMLMLILSPRIFGESFYNPKDIPVLVAMILALYSLLLFCERPSYPRALLHAFTCAFAIDIRIICIILLPATFLMIAMCLYQRNIAMTAHWKKFIVFVAAQFGLMLLMWPILMRGPFSQLWYAYRQLSYYGWDGSNMYLGKSVNAMHTPWHYHWVWMLISLPEVYILLFLAGVFILIRNLFKKGFFTGIKNVFFLLILALFLFPMVFRSISGATVLDGWRHIYFVYPLLVLIVIYGLGQIKYNSPVVRLSAFVLLFAQMGDSAIQIAAMHPFQYVYFNHTANVLFRPIDRKFDMDYWGLSYKQGIEYLLANKGGDKRIKICFMNTPGRNNYKFLTPQQQEKLQLCQYGDTEYFLTNDRDEVQQPAYVPPGKVVNEIRAQGNRIMSIYKLR